MCINLAPKPPKPKPVVPPPAVKPQPKPPKKPVDAKPLKKELEISKVEYGSEGKNAGAAAQRTGTESLKIPLNTGTESTSSTGGLNV